MGWIDADAELEHRPSRVLVAGTSGSGKSTLAREIARVLGTRYFELDALHHGPGWTPNPRFVDEVTARASESAWVTEWQYPATRDLLADRANLLVWLDLPRSVVMHGVIRRTVGRSVRREELWNGNREPPLRSIVRDRDHVIRWAWRTHEETALSVNACVARRPVLSAVALASRQEIAAWVAGPLTAASCR